MPRITNKQKVGMNDIDIKQHRESLTAALRSGEFRQAKYTLRNINKDGSFRYCCLGVACEIWHRETGKGRWERGGEYENASERSKSDISTFYEGPGEFANWNIATIPSVVSEYFGLGQETGDKAAGLFCQMTDLSVATNMIRANDELDKDFAAIADFVDALE